jgi:hypothetical protein
MALGSFHHLSAPIIFVRQYFFNPIRLLGVRHKLNVYRVHKFATTAIGCLCPADRAQPVVYICMLLYFPYLSSTVPTSVHFICWSIHNINIPSTVIYPFSTTWDI